MQPGITVLHNPHADDVELMAYPSMHYKQVLLLEHSMQPAITESHIKQVDPDK